MAQARLKVNIIMDGVNYAVGTSGSDKNKFPNHLRSAKTSSRQARRRNRRRAEELLPPEEESFP